MSQLPPSQPRISDDGKFYWDGSRWVPREMEVVLTGQKRGRSGLQTCAGVIGLVFVLGLFLFIAALWCGTGSTTT